MKILMVHNEYGKYSGEEAAVQNLEKILNGLGHQVIVFRRRSSELSGLSGKIKGFLCGFYNPFSIREFRRILDGEKPDIVHVHNLYPLISPAILPEAARRGIPIVMTVHNYRLLCPSGLLFRDGRPCSLCLDGREWHCLLKNCERSYFKSLGYFLRNRWVRKKRYYLDHVSKYLALSEFQRRILIGGGLPPERIEVLPNALDAPEEDAPEESHEGKYVGFVGRLSAEKGIDLLLESAARLPDIPFHIAGSGAEAWRRSAGANVVFRGYLSGEELTRFWQECRFIVLPSRCYEGFPMVLLSAMYYRKPAVVPDIGGLPELVEDGRNGLLFEFGDAKSLADAVRRLWDAPETALEMGRRGFQLFTEKYTAEHVGNTLNNIYRQLLHQ